MARENNGLDWSLPQPRTGGDTAHHVKLNHGQLKLDKEVQSVFYGDPIKVTEEAWVIVQKQKISPIRVGNTDVYVVSRFNAGYTGGTGAQRINLDYVTIATKQDSNKIITAFPSGSSVRFPDGYIPFLQKLGE